AAHSNKPTSSKIKDIRIIATNASVAFQTISVTMMTSAKFTTPTNNATTAPPIADQPIFKFLGCQMTNTKVVTKITIANMSVDDKLKPPIKKSRLCLLVQYQLILISFYS